VTGIEELGPYWKAIARGRRFHLQAVAREPRTAAISRLEEAVQRRGGFVLDFKAFSDLSINLIVELAGEGVVALVDWLESLGWPVELEPGRDALLACAGERLEGTVQVTFPEGDGALAHPQPAVPG
jgi:hypothetical protein